MNNTIRLAVGEDASQILEIYNPFCGTSPVSFEIMPPSLEEMTGRIRTYVECYPWLVCVKDGQISGYVNASKHRDRAAYRWSVDVAVYIHPSCRGQGLGKSLYSVLFDLLRYQGIYKAYAGITLPNPGSVELHKAVGFTPVGIYHGVGYKAGKWHDVSWSELTLQNEVLDPAEPQAMAAIVGTNKWDQIFLAGERALNAKRGQQQHQADADKRRR